MAGELSPEARELNLVGRVEMRIALAESDTKLEELLKTYLTPLLLKLSSEHVSVRNKVIGVCQHVNRRLKLSTEISLPLQPLLKQFSESNSSLVKQFDIIYIQQGLERLPTEEGIAILPGLLQMCTPSTSSFDLQATEGKLWSLAFQTLLRLLPTWKLPERDSKDDERLKERLALSDRSSTMLAFWLGKFLLYDSKAANGLNSVENGISPLPARAWNGLTAAEMEFLSKFDQVPPPNASRSRLSDTKAAVGNFLFTKAFSDGQRFIPAVILSSDTTNLTAFRTGDTMFKQCNFDLEDDIQIAALFDLYNKSRPRLQMRILALLAKSKRATSQTSDIFHLINSQLASGTEGLEATKLRSAIFQFLNWTVRIGADSDLELIAPRAQTSLKEYIEEQGWPNPIEVTGLSLSGADIDLRSKAYESIGILANKVPPGFELVKWLFTSLRCDLSGSQMHVSIEEALGRVLNVLTINDEQTQKSLKALLLWNSTANVGDEDPQDRYQTRRNTRFASVRYANKCLPFSDIDARYIDLLAIGSTGERQEIIEEGTRGLDPHWYQLNTRNFAPDAVDSTPRVEFPDFAPLVTRLFGKGSSKLQEPTGQQLTIFAAAVIFSRNVLFREALEGTPNAVAIESDYERKIDAVVANNAEARTAIRNHLQTEDQNALKCLIEAAVIGMALNLGRSAEVAVDLCSLAHNDVLANILDVGLTWAARGLSGNNMKTQDQAARVFGVLASHPDHKAVTSTMESLSTTYQNWKGAIGSQVNQIRGSILGYAFTLTRLVLRHSTLSYEGYISDFSQVVSQVISETRDLALREAATTAIGQLSICLPESRHLTWDNSTIVDSLLPDAKKESERAVSALGRLVRVISSDDHDNLTTETLAKLYALQDVKKAELHFAIGETLSVAACGWHSDSTIAEFDIDASMPSRPVDKALLSRIVDKVVADCKTTKPSLKKAAAIWLLCLIQYCGKEQIIRSQLRQCQSVFTRLLSDRDEVVQETGSRGLSLVYEMGDKSLRDDLVRDLVGSFTGSNAKVSGTVNEDTQLFEAGALPTEGGNSVTTYKDIVSLAQEMGDPSLVYRFMNLAANNAIWTSRAAFGRFGLGNVLADSSYLAENKKFYPKLYRYRFDPNPNVQRSMNEIWGALVKDPNKVIDENFDLILEDLLKTILGKEWRSREASCAAIGDLVQGREVEKYEKHLNDIWEVAFKVLDDIKETVRLAAMTLCRTLTNLLIRNLEVGEGTTKRAQTLLQHAMPFLLQQLEHGSAKEVQQYAIVTLLEVVKKSPPRSLKPFAPVILEALINSLSSLEHESINYLHLNADKYGLTAEKLDKMRVSSINASPVTEAIERCLESLDTTANSDSASETAKYVNDAMSKIEGTFKTAIGLPSRVGLSRVIVTLVVRHNILFRPYADRFAQLLRKNLLDRNETISVAFSMSLAYLMRLTSEKQVQQTSDFIRNLYFTSDEASHRVVSGEILHAISKVSNDVFMRHATAFLPLAFLGQSDTDTAVREKFEETWKENVGGTRAINLYLTEIVELVTINIKSTKWPVKHACCLATANVISSGEISEQYTTAQAELLWPVVEEALGGKTWEGKEKVILALPKFVAKSRSLWPLKAKEIRKIALREARRTNVAYRPHAIEALGEFVELLKGLDASLIKEAMSILTTLVEQLTVDDAEDHTEVDGGEGSGKHAS
jgi:proteasome component ECM29